MKKGMLLIFWGLMLSLIHISTAAALTVVEPTANGLGSDAFAIVWHKGELIGLNSSGFAPEAITAEPVSYTHLDVYKRQNIRSA